jgi:hypothetical protein
MQYTISLQWYHTLTTTICRPRPLSARLLPLSLSYPKRLCLRWIFPALLLPTLAHRRRALALL